MIHCRRILIVFCVILISPSCREKSDGTVLKSMESYILSHPERAKSILESLGPESHFSGRDKALYELLYAIALEKNGIHDGKYLSQISEAAKWFAGHHDYKHKMLAYYYWGDQLYDGGYIHPAISAFSYSLEASLAHDNWCYAGKSAWQMGKGYVQTGDPDSGIDYYLKARKYFHQGSFYEDETKMNLLLAEALSETVDAEAYYKMAIDSALVSGKKDVLQEAYTGLVRHAIRFTPESTLKIVSLIDSAYNVYQAKPKTKDLISLSQFHYAQGDQSTAEQYLHQAMEHVQSEPDRISVLYLLSTIEENAGHYEKALFYTKALLHNVEIMGRESIRQSIAKSQRDEYYNRLKREEKKSRNLMTLGLMSSVVILIVLWVLFLYIRQIKLINEKEVLQLRYDLSEKDQELVDLRQRADERYPALKMVMNAYEKLCRQFSESDNPLGLYHVFSKEIHYLSNNELFKQELQKIVMEQGSDSYLTLSRALDQRESIGEDDKQLLYYLIAGLPTAMIMALTKKSRSAVNTRISRLRSKLEASDDALWEKLRPYFIVRTQH